MMFYLQIVKAYPAVGMDGDPRLRLMEFPTSVDRSYKLARVNGRSMNEAIRERHQAQAHGS